MRWEVVETKAENKSMDERALKLTTQMQLVVNGRERSVETGVDLLGLLESLNVDPRLVVVEHNGKILRPRELAGVGLASGDRVEIVQFVGGG
jgi:sulfur carrier protein